MNDRSEMGDYSFLEQAYPEAVEEVAIGEWFSPFIGYEDIWYEYFRADYRCIAVSFNVGQIGKLSAVVQWEKDLILNKPIMLILPNEERQIEGDSVKKWEEILEARLMGFNFYSDNDEEFIYKNVSYKAEVVLPSKRLVEGHFVIDFGFRTVLCDEFDFRGKSGLHEIYIPEAEAMLDKIQVRIVPA